MNIFKKFKEKKEQEHLEKERLRKDQKIKKKKSIINIIGIFLMVVGLSSIFTKGYGFFGLSLFLFGLSLTKHLKTLLDKFKIPLTKSGRIVAITACTILMGFATHFTKTDEFPSVLNNNQTTISSVYKNTNIEKQLSSDKNTIETETNSSQKTKTEIEQSPFNGYVLIKEDYCSLNEKRIPKAVVNIGFGNREYWAFTNEYGQLFKVVASKIILQDEITEKVNSNGEYCDVRANVPGAEISDYDKGQIIADSLGGASNTYNVTPQKSFLNKDGEQADIEKTIRNAGGATDFEVIITYPNTITMIPKHYKYTYKVLDELIVTEFDNANPKTTIETIDTKEITQEASQVTDNTNYQANDTITYENTDNQNNIQASNQNFVEQPVVEESFTRSYVLNTNTKKFHYPDCASVKKIKPKNYSEHFGTRDEIIGWGYGACKNCNP